MRWNFDFFYITRFGTDPLHNCCNVFDFNFEFADIFVSRLAKCAVRGKMKNIYL
jgi:hypothetical protein